MNTMLNAHQYELNAMRRQELMREAAQERLARMATVRKSTLTARLLAPLGRSLVQSGTFLLERAESARTSTAEHMAYRPS